MNVAQLVANVAAAAAKIANQATHRASPTPTPTRSQRSQRRPSFDRARAVLTPDTQDLNVDNPLLAPKKRKAPLKVPQLLLLPTDNATEGDVGVGVTQASGNPASKQKTKAPKGRKKATQNLLDPNSTSKPRGRPKKTKKNSRTEEEEPSQQTFDVLSTTRTPTTSSTAVQQQVVAPSTFNAAATVVTSRPISSPIVLPSHRVDFADPFSIDVDPLTDCPGSPSVGIAVGDSDVFYVRGDELDLLQDGEADFSWADTAPHLSLDPGDHVVLPKSVQLRHVTITARCAENLRPHVQLQQEPSQQHQPERLQQPQQELLQQLPEPRQELRQEPPPELQQEPAQEPPQEHAQKPQQAASQQEPPQEHSQEPQQELAPEPPPEPSQQLPQEHPQEHPQEPHQQQIECAVVECEPPVVPQSQPRPQPVDRQAKPSQFSIEVDMLLHMINGTHWQSNPSLDSNIVVSDAHINGGVALDDQRLGDVTIVQNARITDDDVPLEPRHEEPVVLQEPTEAAQHLITQEEEKGSLRDAQVQVEALNDHDGAGDQMDIEPYDLSTTMAKDIRDQESGAAYSNEDVVLEEGVCILSPPPISMLASPNKRKCSTEDISCQERHQETNNKSGKKQKRQHRSNQEMSAVVEANRKQRQSRGCGVQPKFTDFALAQALCAEELRRKDIPTLLPLAPFAESMFAVPYRTNSLKTFASESCALGACRSATGGLGVQSDGDPTITSSSSPFYFLKRAVSWATFIQGKEGIFVVRFNSKTTDGVAHGVAHKHFVAIDLDRGLVFDGGEEWPIVLPRDQAFSGLFKRLGVDTCEQVWQCMVKSKKLHETDFV